MAPAPGPTLVIDISGAVPASGIDSGVAWHYGEPLQESRALDEGGAFADLSHLGVVTVSGPDRLSWLHEVTTQDLETLPPGRGAEAMILDEGRIRQVFAVVDDGQTAYLISETATGLALLLESQRDAHLVELADESQSWAAIADSTGSENLILNRLAWVDPWPGTADPSHPGIGWRWRLTLVPRNSLASAARDAIASGLRPVGTWATEANRVAAWRPRFLAEARPPAYPRELDWLRTAARPGLDDSRGGTRRLTFLHIDGSGHLPVRLPAAVTLGGTTVGRVTSAALHHDDGPIALALVNRSADPEAVLTVVDADGESAAASQIPVVDPST